MNDLLKLDQQNIWHPFTPLVGANKPILIESADGIFLKAHDGRQIIDAISSWWVNLHGHSNLHIAKAVAEQATILEHVIFAGFTHEPAIKLSANLLSILPPNQSKIFFSDNGSTAVEVALKIALQFWHNQGIVKTDIIALEGAYHGDTFGGMSVGERSIFTSPFTNYLFNTAFVSFPEKGSEEKALQEFKAKVDLGTVAAFIFEPLVQGASGMRMYSAGILDKMIQYAQLHHVICIADEVFTGFGRTGRLFASDYLEGKPDLIALSKGITGGTLPLGATACSKSILKAFESGDFSKTFFHGHSYTANPLACAAANASFTLLLSDDCQERINAIQVSHKKFQEKLWGNKKNIIEVRTIGTILAIELLTPEATDYSNSMRAKIYDFFMTRNILLRPLGNVIYIIPPYIITTEQLESIYQVIEDFINEL
jgi:adenosylmethionine-8-amino-7-oxononanoate aminotransferase